jgi:ribosomal protein L29
MTKKEHMTAKSEQELAKLLVETRAALRAERFAAAGARAKDPNAARKFRKEIARALTEQTRRAHSTPAVA